MNFRTTLYLAVALACVAIVYLWWPREDVPVANVETRPPSTSLAARDLLESKPDGIVKVVCKRKDAEEWVFEKAAESADAGRQVWRMTSPLDMKVVSYEVDGIGRRLSNLSYEVSYVPGEPGAVSAAEAGLDPPQAVVTLTDAGGETGTVEIGKPASARETYVRLGGSKEICVASTSLGRLLKDKPLDYRDQQVWTFKPEEVKRVEIVDRSEPKSPTKYVFSREGARWMMELPVTARATSKVDDMLRTMSRLRVVKWHDDRGEMLATYGLEPAALTVRATVEELVPAKEEDTEEDAGTEEDSETDKPERKITVHELHLSNRSPIGEETKVYIRAGDESAVATLVKSNADKFKPVMSEWREMRITTANITGATRIGLSTGEGSATLVSKDGLWSFDADGGPAEGQAVKDLLKAIADLKAVAFADGEPEDLSALGLDEPDADIRLTIPGLEGVERIAVGGYTETRTKSLRYVRRNDVASVAKVRAADLATLIRSPRAYRDRGVFDMPAGSIEQVALSIENRFIAGRDAATFKRGEDGWIMASPLEAPVRQDRLDELVGALAELRAESIAAEEGEVTAYGLHAPTARVTMMRKPPPEYRLEKPETGEGGDEGGSDTGAEEGKPERTVPVKVQPPSEEYELLVTEHDGRFYAKRADRPTIYEVGEAFYKKLFDEHRTGEVLEFDDAKVRSLSIRRGDEVHVFERIDKRWTYQAEPDLPLDANKVESLLLRVKDLKTERFVDDTTTAVDDYALAEPLHEVSVVLDDGTVRVLRVAEKVCDRDPDKGLYAAVEGRPGVFLLTPSTVQRFAVSLKELEAGR